MDDWATWDNDVKHNDYEKNGVLSANDSFTVFQFPYYIAFVDGELIVAFNTCSTQQTA